MEPIITTEVENALLLMHYGPTEEWEQVSPARGQGFVAEEREATIREARRILDILYDVDRQFTYISLGLLDDG